MYQPLIKFFPHPAIITQVLVIFVRSLNNQNQVFELWTKEVIF